MVRTFQDSGFDIKDTDIEVEDLGKAVFGINRAVWSNDDGEIRAASFMWDAANGKLSNPKVETAMGVLDISEVASLEELKEKSEIIVKKAELDKQRLDEFEKNLQEGISEDEIIITPAKEGESSQKRVKVKR